jgi:cytidylate kinase/uncharacterized membrane protein
MALNALEMTTSTVVQSLGNVVKATAVSFTRQIILFVPIACILSMALGKGIYGILYAGAIADTICFIICIFVFASEYKKLDKTNGTMENTLEYKNKNYKGKKIVITIAREYGSGGHFIGELLAKELKINFYDKEIISLTAKESGLNAEYILENEQKKTKLNSLKSSHMTGLDNEDKIFIAEENVIKNLAEKESCVIVGRCANFILKDNKDVTNIFIYSTMEDKINRAVKYYNIDSKNAKKEINKINKLRENHYKYYTNTEWNNPDNYDLCINVATLGIKKTVSLIKEFVKNK